VGYFRNRPVFLVTHGEEEIAEAFAQALRKKGFEAIVPAFGDTLDLPRRTVVAVPRMPEKEDIIKRLEGEIQKLRGKVLAQESEVLLQSALILLEEAGRRSASADELPKDGV
jgi:metallo-beta-lactamase family protein